MLMGHKAAGHSGRCLRDTDLPGNVGLPAPPGLTEVLQNGPGLVLLDAFRHHV